MPTSGCEGAPENVQGVRRQPRRAVLNLVRAPDVGIRSTVVRRATTATPSVMPSSSVIMFGSRYRCTVDPEFPGTGSWGCATFEFPRTDASGQPFRSPWGAPLVVRVEPDPGEEWVGFFR